MKHPDSILKVTGFDDARPRGMDFSADGMDVVSFATMGGGSLPTNNEFQVVILMN